MGLVGSGAGLEFGQAESMLGLKDLFNIGLEIQGS